MAQPTTAAVKLDEAWMRDALASLEGVTDQDIEKFLKSLADKWIKTVQNVLDAIAGDTWKTVDAPDMFKDLVKKKVAPPNLQTGIESNILDVNKIVQALEDLLISQLDCWVSDARSTQEQKKFKTKIIERYKCHSIDVNGQDNWACMATGIKVSEKDKVIASHIFKASTRGKGLDKFGLRDTDVNNARNGLLLLPRIEEEFDRKRVCFLYDPFKKALLFKILKPMLREKTSKNMIAPGVYLCEFDGLPLQYPADTPPYRRLLNFHARCSISYAIKWGWVCETDYNKDLFDLSDVASDYSVNKSILLRYLEKDFAKVSSEPQPSATKPSSSSTKLHSSSSAKPIKVGDTVKARCSQGPDKGKWFSAKVVQVKNKSYQVDFGRWVDNVTEIK